MIELDPFPSGRWLKIESMVCHQILQHQIIVHDLTPPNILLVGGNDAESIFFVGLNGVGVIAVDP